MIKTRYLLVVLVTIFLSVTLNAEDAESVWLQAKKVGTIESIRDFIRKHPENPFMASAGFELYDKVAATKDPKKIRDYYEEFYDFPVEAEKAKKLYQRVVKQYYNLDSRYTFKEGKIGTQYIPSTTNSYASTTTHYINGNAINETTYKNYSSGGYDTARYGYTAVYQIFNNSNKFYIVRARVSGTSSLSEVGVSTNSWSGKESTYTTTKRKNIAQEISYLLKANDSVKDQIVVGETKPNDFTLDFVDIQPVSEEWIEGLQDALTPLKSVRIEDSDGWITKLKKKYKQYKNDFMMSSKLKLINTYLHDPKANKWHESLQKNYFDIAKKNISTTIKTDERFDRDFSSNVQVTFKNDNSSPVFVEYKPNFGLNGTVKVPADDEVVKTISARGVSKGSLDVDIANIIGVQNSSSANAGDNRAEQLKQYDIGVEKRRPTFIALYKAIEAEKERKAKAAVEEKKRQAIWMSKEIYVDDAKRLVWQDDTDTQTLGKDWKNANEYCSNLEFAESKDWRLPTKNELLDLYAKKANLKNMNPKYYWSSTVASDNNSSAWDVNFKYGYTFANEKSKELNIRCVHDIK